MKRLPNPAGSYCWRVQFFEAEALINARPSTVWDVLTDTSNLTVWDSGITDFAGSLVHGGKIRIKTARGDGRTHRLRVDLKPGATMTWTLRGPLALYKGIGTVTVTPRGAKTQLKATVSFGGPLHRVPARMLPDTGQALRDYVPAVKRRAELLDRAN